MKRTVLISVLALTACLGLYFLMRPHPAAPVAQAVPSPEERSRDLLITPAGVQLVLQAKSAEAFTIVLGDSGNGLPPAFTVETMQVGRTEVVSAELANKLIAILVDPTTYPDLDPSVYPPDQLPKGITIKPCGGFQPRHAVRFRNSPAGKADVTFLICFTCHDIQVVVHNSDGQITHRKLSDFRTPDQRLEQLILKALPNDPFLTQKLARS